MPVDPSASSASAPTAEQLLRQAGAPVAPGPAWAAQAPPDQTVAQQSTAEQASGDQVVSADRATQPGATFALGRAAQDGAADGRPKGDGAGGAVEPAGVPVQELIQRPDGGSAAPVPRPLPGMPAQRTVTTGIPSPLSSPRAPSGWVPGLPPAPGQVPNRSGGPVQSPEAQVPQAQGAAFRSAEAQTLSNQRPGVPGPGTQPAVAPSTPAQATPAQALQSPAAQKLERALADPSAREPLPLGARAQLAPLLGQDLPNVQLVRGALAAEATSAAAADALAVGNTVLLSPGQDLSSPRSLALLAHELTHVLRARDPGFVPAIARLAAGGGAQPAPTQTGVRAAHLDEEALAEQVEGQVRAQMERRPAAGTPTPARQRPPGGAAGGRPAPDAWGGLPAPWEPLPHWDAPASPAAPARSAPTPTPAAAPAASAPASGGAPVARAASSTRSVDGGASSSGGSAAELAQAKGPSVGNDQNKSNRNSPDLDRLAQQVYALLKRRLSTEVRRGH